MTARGHYRNPRRKIIVERQDAGDYLVLWPDNRVSGYAPGEETAILTEVRRRDALRVKALERHGKRGIAVTEIEWRNIPEGFQPPQ